MSYYTGENERISLSEALTYATEEPVYSIFTKCSLYNPFAKKRDWFDR